MYGMRNTVWADLRVEVRACREEEQHHTHTHTAQADKD